MPLSWNEIKSRAIAFSQEWEDETSEDAEAKSFWDGFFHVFGISRRRVATFEQSVKKADNKQGFIDLLWKGVILVEHKSRGKSLDKAMQQAKDYFPSNEAKGNAAVHCVIIGFGLQDIENKRVFDYVNIKGEPTERKVKNINPYLAEGNDLIILKRNQPIGNIPEMLKSSQPTDGGNLLMTDEEKIEYVIQEPSGEKFIKPFIYADEFLNGKKRWCFWLKDIQPNELKKLPLLSDRVSKVRKMRLSSTKQSTVKWADFPTLFTENRQPNTDYLLVPRVSSENRKYIPIGFFESSVIASDSCITIPNATLYLFGILTSEMHITWVKYVCGRLESRFRYSNTIVYNNYPFPENVNEKQKQKVEIAAQAVLDTRDKYPDSSLADLYDPLTMPPDLVKAHQILDKAVDLCWR